MSCQFCTGHHTSHPARSTSKANVEFNAYRGGRWVSAENGEADEDEDTLMAEAAAEIVKEEEPQQAAVTTREKGIGGGACALAAV